MALDKIDCAILEQLQSNARMSFAELGRHVGLSTPAVIERVRRLEDAEVILGYRAEVDYARVGLPVSGFIKVTVAGDKLFGFGRVAEKVPEILECHRVTGPESYILRFAVEDLDHMERIIDSLMPYVSTITSLIIASPIRSRAVVPRCAEEGTSGSKAASLATSRGPGVRRAPGSCSSRRSAT